LASDFGPFGALVNGEDPLPPLEELGGALLYLLDPGKPDKGREEEEIGPERLEPDPPPRGPRSSLGLPPPAALPSIGGPPPRGPRGPEGRGGPIIDLSEPRSLILGPPLGGPGEPLLSPLSPR